MEKRSGENIFFKIEVGGSWHGGRTSRQPSTGRERGRKFIFIFTIIK
mgnify:CR=1 FL=1